MKVFINKQEVTIFEGANVGDAVLSYSKRSYKKIMDGNLIIIDSFGNITEPDGKLKEGQVIRIKKKAILNK